MLTTRAYGPVRAATLPVVLDAEAARRLRGDLLSVLRRQSAHLVLDLRPTVRVDAAGIALLLATRRRAMLLGGSLRLVRDPEGSLARTLRAHGVELLTPTHPSVREAIDAALAAVGARQADILAASG